MRKKASGLLEQIMRGLKAKTMAIKSKTKAIKTRLLIFSLLQNRKLLMSSFSDKLNALMGQGQHNHDKITKELEIHQQSHSIVLYNSSNAMSTPQTNGGAELEEMEMEMIEPGASVIDIVKNSREEKGQEFRLEDEIDRVADLFIKRFHRQIRMQKQLSLGTTP
ncbi:hypothetical protein like AT5G13880 [Hibiscus trionum]|uniref:Uncharacterized protein n=1 Tax=Hibiscus trionum TaxID=183268 RepID=A0A9W7JAQ1_HIBTR|nr:hypothetical protein like AT5G13880 [Hibiscus trionum]